MGRHPSPLLLFAMLSLTISTMSLATGLRAPSSSLIRAHSFRMSETEIPDLTFAAAETARMTETETLDLTFAAAEARIKAVVDVEPRKTKSAAMCSRMTAENMKRILDEDVGPASMGPPSPRRPVLAGILQLSRRTRRT